MRNIAENGGTLRIIKKYKGILGNMEELGGTWRNMEEYGGNEQKGTHK